jgi:hypothetical protein
LLIKPLLGLGFIVLGGQRNPGRTEAGHPAVADIHHQPEYCTAALATGLQMAKLWADVPPPIE